MSEVINIPGLTEKPVLAVPGTVEENSVESLSDILADNGVFCVGVFAGLDAPSNGWVNVFISVDPKWGAARFSINVESELYKAFKSFEVGDVVLVKTGTPAVGTSKAGKQYLRWFASDVFQVS